MAIAVISEDKSGAYGATRLSALADMLAATPLPAGPLQTLKAEVDGLAARMDRGELQCAILGQMKRGKSSLLNAIIGTTILPSAVTPLTAISTYVRGGRRYAMHSEGESGSEELCFADAKGLGSALAERVTERGNPRNRRRLRRVDVEVISPRLQNGLTFIDTPGIGSTHAHNTKVAIATLPACDVALFVISPDPPLTASELDYLKDVLHHVAEVIVILNKVDTVDKHDEAEIVEFVQTALAEAGICGLQLFSVSARRKLDETSAGVSARDESGFDALSAYLSSIATNRRTGLVSDVSDLKAATLAREMIEYLDQYLAALSLPVDVLKHTLSTFEASAAALEREINHLDDLVTVSRNGILRALDQEVASLRDSVRDELVGEINQRLAANQLEATIASDLERAAPAKFAARFSHFEHRFMTQANVALAAHVESAEHFLRKAREAGRDLLQLSYECPSILLTIPPNIRPYWVDSQRPTISGGVSGFYDQLLPQTVRLERARARLIEKAQELSTRNAEQLRWSIRRAIEETFRSFVSTWKATLDRAQSATRAAIMAGLSQLHQTHEGAKPEITELQRLRTQISDRFEQGTSP